MREQTNKILKTLCVYMLVISMMLSSVAGSWQVMAAGIPAPTIDKVFYDATKISGGNVHRQRVSGKVERGTIHVTLKNGNTVKAELSVTPKSGTTWIVNLPENVKVAEGDVVTAYQEYKGSKSGTVTANAEPSKAYENKDKLKMPVGEIWIENPDANLVNNDEQAEAIEMLKKANPDIANDFDLDPKKTKFSINGTDHAYYEVTYTDGSSLGKIEATDLKIKQVTETSAAPTIEKVQVTDGQIVVTLQNEVTEGTKFYFIKNFTDGEQKNFCEGGSCKVDKSNSQDISQAISIVGKKITFSVNNDDLELGKEFGILVKEPHKFRSCAKSEPVITTPDKVDVKDPKKLTEEEKKTIAKAIRDANTVNGKSKLPDGTGFVHDPAFIEVSDDGKVKIISPNDVETDWDNDGNPIYKKNPDGTVIVSNENNVIHFDKPEELLKNIAPDTPKMENKSGKVVVTPNIEVDTDAKKVVVEYEGADGKTTITATKTDTGWTVDNDKAKVDENGVVTIPTKEIKTGTKVIASVEDDGGLVPEEKALDSGKAELLIENKYKVTYDAGEGSGTMADEEVEAGKNYTILDNAFTAPTDKEFDHWMIGFEPKKPGETTEVNNDITIKAIWKYIINPTAGEVETVVGHPVDYDMYKKAIKDFPAALTVEHIEVKTAPDISKVGGTKATIEVRFSDGQFRTIPVTVNVKPDPKDKEIEKLNKDIEGLNKQITDLNNKISEKDGKITELNGKITELEGKLQECKNQCAIDKAECEKAKEALNKQIQDLTVEKTRLETVVHDYDELIKELRAHQETLNKQITDLKETVKGKDAEIAKLNEKITTLDTKIDTLTKENTGLKEKLATANQEILNLKAKVTDLEGQVKDLTEKLNAKETEIKTLNDTITTLKEKIATLEAEKAKDKEAYEKEKANLEKQVQDAKDSLTTKETELNSIKEELKTANNDLAAEKAKTSGLTEQVKAKDEKIADLEKQIADLKKKAEEAGNNNTTIIKEKETIIEKLTSEKAELEKQLATEKAKNEMLEKQITDLNKKADKASEDLNNAKTKISDLEKQLAVEQEKNKTLTEQLNKITTDLDAKTKEVETLNKTVTDLKAQIAKITAEQAKDKEACEKAKAELQEKLDKANQELTTKNTELDNIKKELEQAKKDLAAEQAKNAGLTEKTKAQEEKIAGLEEQLKALQGKLDKADTDLKAANEKIAELEKELAAKDADNKNLTAQVEKLGKDLEAKTTEVNNLNAKIVELEKQVSEKTAKGEADAKEIERLKNELADLKAQLEKKNTDVENLNNQIVTLKETIKTLEGEKTELTNNVTRLEKEAKELKDKVDSLNEKILKLVEENATLKETNKNLNEKVTNLEKDKVNLEKDKTDLQEALKKSEEDKAKLEEEKKALEVQVSKLREDLSKCPADQTEKVKELEKQISEKENQISEKIKDIAAKDAKITELSKALAGANDKIADLNKKLIDLASQPREKEYIYIRDNYTPSYNGDVYSLNLEIEALRRENRELKDKIAKLSQGQDCSLMAKERFVTIFSLKSMLYKTYLGDELMTQAEMMDLKGFIEPFISNNRTMLPLRYVALSLGLDVDWNHSTRTATFTNRDSSNALNPGKITINANTLEMKDQYGNNIAVDSKPMLKNGRFYISITNLTKAFGGTNGNLADGVRNTIEWDSQGRRVLVYKYSK